MRRRARTQSPVRGRGCAARRSPGSSCQGPCRLPAAPRAWRRGREPHPAGTGADRRANPRPNPQTGEAHREAATGADAGDRGAKDRRRPVGRVAVLPRRAVSRSRSRRADGGRFGSAGRQAAKPTIPPRARRTSTCSQAAGDATDDARRPCRQHVQLERTPCHGAETRRRQAQVPRLGRNRPPSEQPQARSRPRLEPPGVRPRPSQRVLQQTGRLQARRPGRAPANPHPEHPDDQSRCSPSASMSSPCSSAPVLTDAIWLATLQVATGVSISVTKKPGSTSSAFGKDDRRTRRGSVEERRRSAPALHVA